MFCSFSYNLGSVLTVSRPLEAKLAAVAFNFSSNRLKTANKNTRKIWQVFRFIIHVFCKFLQVCLKKFYNFVDAESRWAGNDAVKGCVWNCKSAHQQFICSWHKAVYLLLTKTVYFLLTESSGFLLAESDVFAPGKIPCICSWQKAVSLLLAKSDVLALDKKPFWNLLKNDMVEADGNWWSWPGHMVSSSSVGHHVLLEHFVKSTCALFPQILCLLLGGIWETHPEWSSRSIPSILRSCFHTPLRHDSVKGLTQIQGDEMSLYIRSYMHEPTT